MDKLQTIPMIKPGVIRTYTGKMINVFNPDPSLICIEDIAHALSNLCRFGGHSRQFYSVAEHSVMVAGYVRHRHKLAALLHDASEAYLVDIPSPVKYFIPKYQEYEQNMMLAISEKFGFEFPLHPDVKKADREALEKEWSDILTLDKNDYTLLRPEEAERRFLNYFEFQTLDI